MQVRQVVSSRKVRILALIAIALAGAASLRHFDLLPRSQPEAGILVIDLRQGLPDKAQESSDGRRSISAVTVLRALDAARDDRRIAGLYLRVGSRSMSLAQASEIADAVLRLRHAGKFAVVYSGGFTAENSSDRVLAVAADEIWTAPHIPEAQSNAIDIPPPGSNGLDGEQIRLFGRLLGQASQRIAASRDRHGAGSSMDAVAQKDGLPLPQHRRGHEARAEAAALAWGGAGAGFVDLIRYREKLDKKAAGKPVIALIQAEGLLDMLEGSAPHDLAGPMAARIRDAAEDPLVAGIVIRMSAVAASEEAFSLLLDAAETARREGTPVGFSFGQLIPSQAATLGADLPVSAVEGALLIKADPGTQAVNMARRLREFSWANSSETPDMASASPEVLLLQQRAVAAAVPPRRSSLPAGAVNPVPEAPSGSGENATLPGGIEWTNDVGTLLEMRDRIAAEHKTGASLRMVPYERRASVWSRTEARFISLWQRMTDFGRDVAS